MSKDKLIHVSEEQWATLCDHDIAENNGLKATAVRYFRKSRKKPSGPRKVGSGRPPKYDLTLFSPLRDDRANAERIGCTIAYANLLKNRLRQSDIA